MMPAAAPGPLQLDMRISASHLRLPPLTVDDAALSVMTRGDRIEIGLNEGTAYGGALKGRLSVGTAPDGLSLRGAGSLDGADASAMGWDLVGRQVAAGDAVGLGRLSKPAATPSPPSWPTSRAGRAAPPQTATSPAPISASACARLARGRSDEAAAALGAGRTPFRTLTFDMRLDGGVATIGEAAMQGRDTSLTAGGSIDIGARRLDMHAVAATPEIATSGPRARLPLEIGGTFDKPVFRAETAPCATRQVG